MKVVPEVDLTLSFEGIDTRNDIPGYPSAVASKINAICRDLVLGYEDVYGGARFLSDPPSTPNTYCRYYFVVVAPGWQTDDNLLGYLDWLRYKGDSVEIHVPDPATDKVGDIKGEILDWCGLCPEGSDLYVLLVGDAPDHEFGSEIKYPNPKYPDTDVENCGYKKIATYGHWPAYIGGHVVGTTWSDYYYCLITGNPPDPIPDIAVGRWCSQSSEDLFNIIVKSQNYERDVSDDWVMEEMMFIGAIDKSIINDDFWFYKEELLTTLKQQPWWGENGYGLICHEIPYDKAGRATARNNIVDILNNNGGVSVVNFFCHGTPYTWDGKDETSGPFGYDVEGFLFDNDNIYTLLENNSYPPLVFNICCLTGGVTNPANTNYHESMVEAWTNDEHGAVGAWGASRQAQGNQAYKMDQCLFGGLYDPVDGGGLLDVGYAINHAKLQMLIDNNYDNVALQDARSFYWIGDPGLDVWRGHAEDAYIVSGTGVPWYLYFRVLKSSDNVPVEGAQVCAYDDANYHRIDSTDADGWVVFPIPQSPPFIDMYNLRITATNQKGPICIKPTNFFFPFFEESEGIEENEVDIVYWNLGSILPNPFNSYTTISFSVAGKLNSSEVQKVELSIFDVTGRQINVLASAEMFPGSYKITWNGKDGRGTRCPPGVYFAKMYNKEFLDTKRLVLIR